MDLRHDSFDRLSALSSVGIPHGTAARLENARGMRLCVESGSVWVTHEGSRDDVLLNAGETFRVDRDGSTVISALGRRMALVSIEPPAPRAPL